MEPKQWPAPGKATQLQVIPADVTLHPGEKAAFRVRSLDVNGFTVEPSIPPTDIKWSSYVPPTAKVKSVVKGVFNQKGRTRCCNRAGGFSRRFSGRGGRIEGLYTGTHYARVAHQ